tara:strand:- start:1282 stop:8805 length:7524 start_codon:yes stop_codon:yes gene_type:complete
MAQKTNLNVNPYFDDFDVNKNFYKVLFNPGRPIQSRELNSIQSILQNQLETFGSHIFKEGSMVIPGGVTYDGNIGAVKLNPTSFGVNIVNYIEKFVGLKIRGEVSGLNASVKKVILPNNDIDYITLYVKYLESGSTFSGGKFIDGEQLIATSNISYGINNTLISSGTSFASLISNDATATAGAVSVENGVYFIRGNFVSVNKESLILDYYTNVSSYRVGFSVTEEIVTAKDDVSLFDNAKGFNNFSAPGADRFKIKLSLSKKLLSDTDDTNFVELVRVQDGVLKKTASKTEYSQIRDYLAKRTYEESGNYTVDGYQISINNSLNNLLGNNGKYFEGQKTAEGNIPTDNLLSLTLSPGKAYVNGYDIDKTISTVVDVDKPRSVQTQSGVSVPFTMGNILRVNNVYSSPKQREAISFYSRRRPASGTSPAGLKIGEGRCYVFKLTDAAYVNDSSVWDLHLYDVKFFTVLDINAPVTSDDIRISSRVRGESSGAIGYTVYSATGISEITVRQESGTFLKNENIIIDENPEIKRTIAGVTEYNADDIKSVFWQNPGLEPDFIADTVLETRIANGFSSQDLITISPNGTVTSSKQFAGITTDSVIKYSLVGLTSESFVRVSSVSADQTQLTVETVPNVIGVTSSVLPESDTEVRFTVGVSDIKNPNSAYLYSPLPDKHVASLNSSSSRLSFTARSTTSSTITGNKFTIGLGDFDLPSSEGNVTFSPFVPEKYSITYNDGTIQSLTSDQVSINTDSTGVTFYNLPNKQLYSITASFIKSGIQSKQKLSKKSTVLNVTLSKYSGSGSTTGNTKNDGLTYNRFYGLRVQDEEICLRYPDVSNIIAVYESLDNSDAILDKATFSSLYSVGSNAIIGESIVGTTSKAIARVVSRSGNDVYFVYLNGRTFNVNERIQFENSNILAPLTSLTPGRYRNITNEFRLDKGHKDQYSDYSRLVRKKEYSEPTRRLKVIFDHFDVSSTELGDAFTVLSYNQEDYQNLVPRIGRLGVRASDAIDFRPRVPYFANSLSCPYDFTGREFGSSPSVILTPDETSLIDYDIYLGRVDSVYLDASGGFTVKQGAPSTDPKPPLVSPEVLEIAKVYYPPYLYDVSNAVVNLIDNRRYTMKDIGVIEKRVETLERTTSLSLLELNTQTLQIQDADGMNRFKTGFFADSFKDDSFISLNLSLCGIEEDTGEMGPMIARNALANKLVTKDIITDSTYDSEVNYTLLDSNIKKTGRVITLDYKEDDWIEQALATRVENVNPFHVIQYVGDIQLNPFRDIWIRTEQLEDKTIKHALTLNLESSLNTERISLNTTDNTTGSGSGGLGVGAVRDTFTNLYLGTGDHEVEDKTFSRTDSDSDVAQDTANVFVEQVVDQFMRSRNTQFSVTNLKAFTRYYPFLDQFSEIDVTPKLIEIASGSDLQSPGANGLFEIGETVAVHDGNKEIMRFRVAQGNHKTGPFNNPIRKFDTNPYNKSETIPDGYNQSSTTLNIDTLSLSDDPNGSEYGGYLIVGAQLSGLTSGASAFVKDIRLITDNYGDVIGTFFIRDPNAPEPPLIRVPTGNKTFKLSSSMDASNGLLGSSTISSAEANYVSEGTVNRFQSTTRITSLDANLKTTNNVRIRTLHAVRNENISTTNIPAPVQNFITNVQQDITNVTNITQQIIAQQEHDDPLAQTFLVGTARGLNSFNDDENGAFLTGIDLFFAKVDSGNAPITIQVRTTEMGIPTLTIIGDPVTLRPTDIVSGTTTTLRDNVSTDGSVATNVKFPYPIFLPPGLEYAIVLMAPESDEYEVFTARMGEPTINTRILPDVENVRYTQQFAIGSLFKSQNGSTWTPDQYEDLKFKLYKANFTSTSGTAYFENTNLSKSNGYVRRLNGNPITTLPRKLKVGITTVYDVDAVSLLSSGRKVGENTKSYVHGSIVSTGSSVSNVAITQGGRNYSDGSSTVSTYSINGNGTGLTLSISASEGEITSVTILEPGNGYAIGDSVGIVTADITGTANVQSGENAVISVEGNSDSVDTLYLTDVQGDNFSLGTNLVLFTDGGSTVSLGATTTTTSTTYDPYYDGDYIKVDHFNHGMYGPNNRLEISGVQPDTPQIKITASMSSTETSLNVASSDISLLNTIEGLEVTTGNYAYLQIGSEIIKYTNASGTSVTGLERGQFGTVAVPHQEGESLQKWELAGVNLARINTKFDIADSGIGLDSYYLQIRRQSTDLDNNPVAADRSTDDGVNPKLNFAREVSAGSITTRATENIVYDTVTPYFSIITPNQGTTVESRIRTITGTSCNGSETSFTDLGYEDIGLNTPNKLSSLRMIASKLNEDTYLSSMPRNKSQIMALSFRTNNYNLSPMIFLDDTVSEYTHARLNNPISDYANDNRVNTLFQDPHQAYYISKPIRMAQPSNTLRVVLSAYKHASADFRVLYSLIRAESGGGLDTFDLFPGYNNLTIDTDLDGYLDVVNPTNNNGLSDFRVPDSLENQFLEYQYTAPNVGPFIGFRIKIVMSGTRMDKYPRFRDVRAIALV